jgi:hypothetical protein
MICLQLALKSSCVRTARLLPHSCQTIFRNRQAATVKAIGFCFFLKKRIGLDSFHRRSVPPNGGPHLIKQALQLSKHDQRPPHPPRTTPSARHVRCERHRFNSRSSRGFRPKVFLSNSAATEMSGVDLLLEYLLDEISLLGDSGKPDSMECRLSMFSALRLSIG